MKAVEYKLMRMSKFVDVRHGNFMHSYRFCYLIGLLYVVGCLRS